MKKLLAVLLCVMLALVSLIACSPAVEKEEGQDVKHGQNVEQKQEGSEANTGGVGTVSVSDASVTSATKSYVRKDAEVPEAEKYMFTATVTLTGTGSDYRAGLSAGANTIPQNMDFVYMSTNGGGNSELRNAVRRGEEI